MRTTITLDPDTEEIVRRRMRELGVSFKRAVNDAIRESERRPATKPFRTKTYDMGKPLVNLDKALQLAGELEDEELIRKTRLGK